MTDLSAIQSVGRVLERIGEIEAKVGMRQLVRNPKAKPAAERGAQKTAQPSFDQVLQKELGSGRSQGVLPSATLTHSGRAAQETAAAIRTGLAARESAAGSAPHTGNEYSELIRQAAARHGVDARLVSAVAEAESDFDQSCVSSAGAIGVMQLMPETAAMLGVNPYDAGQNIEGGVKYLSQMLNRFGGDVRKAVAAYNAGPQAVIDYNGVPPYSETQSYVNTVLDLYR